MSFLKSFELAKVPIVFFKQSNISIGFLLDTGGDFSYIDKSILEKLEIEKKNKSITNIVTGNGKMASQGTALIKFNYHENTYVEEFTVGDFKSAFEASFGKGTTVCGVLGSNFLEKYGCILDYNKKHAICKKQKK